MMQFTCIIKQTEQQRTYGSSISFLVPSEARDNAVAFTLVFDLQHRAFVGFVCSIDRFGNNTIKTRTFKPTKPISRNFDVFRRRSYMKRRFGGAQYRLHFFPTLFKRDVAEIAIALTEKIEEHNRCRHCFREEFYTRSCGMNTKL